MTTPISWASTPEDESRPVGIPVTTRTERSTAAKADNATRATDVEQEAFGKGYARGEAEGFKAGQQRAEEMLRRMADTLEQLGTVRQSMIRQTEQQMLHLSLAIAKRILRREVTLDPEITLAMARVALDRLGEHSGATIRLHPEDYAMATGAAGYDWPDTSVTLEVDDQISRGGCHIESAFGFVDASVDAQFGEVAKAVVGDEAAATSVAVE